MKRIEAAKLMKKHNPRIAKAAAKHIQRLVPRYRDVDATAMERNMRTLLSGFEHMLANDDDSKVIQFVDDIVELRATAGFQMNEILMAAMTLLPVLRRFFLHICQTPNQALAYYDELEARALPVVVTLAEAIAASNRARELNQDSPEVFRDFFLSALEEDPTSTPFPPFAFFEDENEETVRESRK